MQDRNVNVDPASGFWHRVEVGCVADFSEKHIASITRADGYDVLIQLRLAQTTPT
jgi:hypothetical protein